MSEPLDRNRQVKKGTGELGPEGHPDERASRLRHDKRQAQREHETYDIALVAIVLIGLACAYAVFRAQTVLTIIVSGGIGFLTGRRVSKV